MPEAEGQRRRPGHQYHKRESAQHFRPQDACQADRRGAKQGEVAAFVGQGGSALLAADQEREVRHGQHAKPEARDVPGTGQWITGEQQHGRQSESDQADDRAGAPAGVADQGAPILLHDRQDGSFVGDNRGEAPLQPPCRPTGRREADPLPAGLKDRVEGELRADEQRRGRDDEQRKREAGGFVAEQQVSRPGRRRPRRRWADALELVGNGVDVRGAQQRWDAVAAEAECRDAQHAHGQKQQNRQ